MAIDLAAVLNAEGVNTRAVGRNWRTHVRPGAFVPEGIIVHHTADKGRGDSGLSVLIDGRADLNGPLCNLSPREDGTVALVSAGRANHAGMGSSRVLGRLRTGRPPEGRAAALGLADDTVGNGLFYGIEVDNDGLGQKYPAAQIEATLKTCAAILRAHGWGPHKVILHSEWSKRKVDWSYCDGATLRALVARELKLPVDNGLPKGPFPLPDGHWFGVDDGTLKSHSGARKVDRWAIMRIQRLVGTEPDGMYGPTTRSYVSRWKAKNHSDGRAIVDRRTWERMAAK